jgi:hypothetical protein
LDSETGTWTQWPTFSSGSTRLRSPKPTNRIGAELEPHRDIQA